MRAMILAAGRGERLRPITDTIPKPLIQVGEWRLIEYQILALKKIGISKIVINVAWLADLIIDELGDGSRLGVDLVFSEERDGVLGTAGGIARVLPLLGEAPFIICNADVWTDFDYAALRLKSGWFANLVLVDNPPHHLGGDFSLEGEKVVPRGEHTLTFSGMGIYSPEFFRDVPSTPCELAPLLHIAIEKQQVAGVKHTGYWLDVGTAQRLETVRRLVAGP